MLKHGNRCVCRLLAEAVGLKPDAIGYLYCRAVLRKHWTTECNHGCLDDSPAANSSESGTMSARSIRSRSFSSRTNDGCRRGNRRRDHGANAAPVLAFEQGGSHGKQAQELIDRP